MITLYYHYGYLANAGRRERTRECLPMDSHSHPWHQMLAFDPALVFAAALRKISETLEKNVP